MTPCIFWPAGHACIEISGGFEETALREVAMPHGEPGPQRGDVLGDCSPQGRLRAAVSPPARSEVPSMVRSRLWVGAMLAARTRSPGGEIGIPKRTMVARTVGEQY